MKDTNMNIVEYTTMSIEWYELTRDRGGSSHFKKEEGS